jgi:hypothetical protein
MALMLACLSLRPPHAGAKVTHPRAADPRRTRTQALQPLTDVERQSKERREGAAALGPTVF